MVLYDRQSFLAGAGGPNFTEGDWIFSPSFSSKTFFNAAAAPKFPANATDETALNASGAPSEEQWLDQNSLPLLINRYDGTIIKGE